MLLGIKNRQIEGPLETPRYHSDAFVSSDLRGPSIRPLLCRETCQSLGQQMQLFQVWSTARLEFCEPKRLTPLRHNLEPPLQPSVKYYRGVSGGLNQRKCRLRDDSLSDDCTHRYIFSKSYQITPKSDCIYHFRIDLEQQTDTGHLLFVINRCMVKYNLIYIWFNKIQKRFLSVQSCSHCQTDSSAQVKEPLVPLPPTHRPWDRVGMDLFELENEARLMVLQIEMRDSEIDSCNEGSRDTTGFSCYIAVTLYKFICI